MRAQIVNSVRYTCSIAGIAFALMSSNAAISAETPGANSTVCADREALLETLIEAHGAAPNAASEKLAAEAMPLMQAQAACANGHVSDAVALYDRLILELTRTLTETMAYGNK